MPPNAGTVGHGSVQAWAWDVSTISTLAEQLCATLLGTLPNMKRRMPVIPRLPTTTKSVDAAVATRSISNPCARQRSAPLPAPRHDQHGRSHGRRCAGPRYE